MALFKITLIQSGSCNAVLYEEGMSVEIASRTKADPISSNSCVKIVKAFKLKHGIDVKRAGVLNSSNMVAQLLE